MNAGIGIGIFLLAYISNVCFSLYYNIKILGQAFNKEQIWNSILKVITFIIGCSCLIVVVTGLPIFANQMGLPLPDEFVNNLTMVSVIGFPMYGAVKYAMMAFQEMKEVLESGTVTLKEIEELAEQSKNMDEKEIQELIDSKVEEEKINKNVGTLEEEYNGTPDIPNFENMEKEQIID